MSKATFIRLKVSRLSGVTLMEMLISLSLMSLLLTLVLALHLNGQKMWAKGADSEGILGEGLIALKRLTKDLKRSAFPSVSFSVDETAVAFLSTDSSTEQAEYNSDGNLVWDSWLVYYQLDNQFIRREIPWSDPVNDRVFPTTLDSHSGQPISSFQDGGGRVLCKNFVSSSFSRVDSTDLVHYELVFRAERNKDRNLRLEGSLSPRNI